MEKKELAGVKVYLVEGTSKKTGNEYRAVRVEFDADHDLDLMVFLKKVESKVYDLYVKKD